ncbi:MAG: family 2 glycosyl transferase [Parcubacteria group bacterium Gr01-1014_2]|nr:MAG: family 2 glycosyl transferase [Parcubacteria group bacterium Gr01-1014_2]
MQTSNIPTSFKKIKDEPELSVVVLCYKSGETLIPYVEQMEKELREGGMDNYELVLVGNYFPGTNDKTPLIIRKLAEKNPKIVPITLEKKGMLGWDVIMGFKATNGKAIAFIDGDGQMPSQDIVRLFRVLKSGEFDLVKTFRKMRMDGAYRKFISNWYNMIFHILFPGASFRDVNAKPKLMTREAYNKMNLSCDGWFIDGEIMLESMRLDMNVAEVPTVFHKNEWRGSFIKIWAIFEFLAYMVFYRIKYWFK